jgi:hypothetical protein
MHYIALVLENKRAELKSCRCHIACPVLAGQRRRSEPARGEVKRSSIK